MLIPSCLSLFSSCLLSLFRDRVKSIYAKFKYMLISYYFLYSGFKIYLNLAYADSHTIFYNFISLDLDIIKFHISKVKFLFSSRHDLSFGLQLLIFSFCIFSFSGWNRTIREQAWLSGICSSLWIYSVSFSAWFSYEILCLIRILCI